MKEKENILDILVKSKKAVKEENVVLLKELSNKTIHSASIYGDLDNIAIAVIVYSLSKLIERKRYAECSGWKRFFKRFIMHMDLAAEELRKNNEMKFHYHVQEIIQGINKLSGKFGDYIKDVFKKARINKASRIYEHGVSMEKTAKLLGISMWELAEYAGQTGISDANLGISKNVKDRIMLAEKVFS